jgi:hypothetical protein
MCMFMSRQHNRGNNHSTGRSVTGHGTDDDNVVLGASSFYTANRPILPRRLSGIVEALSSGVLTATM